VYPYKIFLVSDKRAIYQKLEKGYFLADRYI
jgi:hypothetical protein